MVPLIIPTEAIRLCGDIKVTYDQQLVVDSYPTLAIDNLQEKMTGGTLFSKPDLSQASSQVKSAEEPKTL